MYEDSEIYFRKLYRVQTEFEKIRFEILLHGCY